VPQKRIVLVEDNPSDALLLKLCLEGITTDVDLTILRDGEAALDFLTAERQKAEPTPCLVLMDLHLPKREGLEILADIRRAPALEHVTVLVLTALPTPHQQAAIKELGATYVEKPSSLDGYELLAAQVLGLCEPHGPTNLISSF
jgi:CheY-like chemotaxis protein